MTGSFRLPSGGRVDRTRVLRFRFNGRMHEGFAGDTLASALLANGVHLVGRSFKYHRPRGILSAGSDEPSALVTVIRDAARRTPNLRATQVELYEGLQAESQNHFPSLAWDAGAINGVLSPLLPAGFYYKTFKWPAWAWRRVYEPMIRRAAGLGRAPAEPDPDRYVQRFAHCDVLVVGAGAAGRAAALAAARTGARVIVCDEHPAIADVPGAQVTLLPRTTAFGYYPHNLVGLAQRLTDHLPSPDPRQARERLWQVRAKEIVLATGALERPLVFPGNDRPGIMLSGAAETYLRDYAVLPGRRIVVVTAHDAAYRAAEALREAGAQIVRLVDTRQGATITGTGGRTRVAWIRLGTGEVLPCDTVLVCGGFTPSVHLFSQARGPLRFDAACQAFVPASSLPGLRAVGACAGDFGPDFGAGGTLGALDARGKAFVDFQNDVTAKDIGLAVREGFRSIEHIKRYTTTGMATDQGKTANVNALGIAADALALAPEQVGLTTFRPPFTPATFGIFAGAARGSLFDPVRETPLHNRAVAAGAVFEDVGQWRRAHYFPRAGESMHTAVARECRAVRAACGLFDGSTLGKIEVVGPDAATFLDRIYINSFSSLKPGRCRYGVMLREDGFVLDDGVVGRLAADRFHVTTTTGGAARVLALMEDYRQTEWPELDVWLTSVTEQWAVIGVQGPRARELLAPLTDADLVMPHMSVTLAQVCGVPARVFRVSFTGELGYELNVPPDAAEVVWDAIAARGAIPYGTEAMHLLRAEKGYIIAGQEADGTTTPDDLGLTWAIGKAKRDFIGKRSLMLPALAAPGRRQLVGLLPDVLLDDGAQIVADPRQPAPMRVLGHVTSTYVSPTLNRPIALALLADGRARMGERLHVPMPDGAVGVQVVSPVFYDPQGERLHG